MRVEPAQSTGRVLAAILDDADDRIVQHNGAIRDLLQRPALWCEVASVDVLADPLVGEFRPGLVQAYEYAGRTEVMLELGGASCEYRDPAEEAGGSRCCPADCYPAGDGFTPTPLQPPGQCAKVRGSIV
jgi:hypothetical protein